MSIQTLVKTSALVLLLTTLSACETGHRMPPNEAMLAAKPRSILVLPPTNDSVEVNAPYVFISTVTRPLAEKGYYVFPVAVIDLFMKEQGLPTPDEMNGVPLDKLYEHIRADAVLYTHIDEWGQKFMLLSSKAIVSAKLRLVDARTGDLLWQGEAYAEHDNNSGNNQGLLGALVGAVVDQIAGSLKDHTYELSRQANNRAIGNSRSFIEGPYFPQEQRAQ